MKAFIASIYDQVQANLEVTHYRAVRKELLTDAWGVCLEIGAGTGASIGAWPESTIERLVISEPCDAMRTQLALKVKCAEIEGSPAFPVEPEILNFAISGYKSVPFEDNTFDIILVSLVLCAVGDQRESVREIKRVLKPGGKLLYLST